MDDDARNGLGTVAGFNRRLLLDEREVVCAPVGPEPLPELNRVRDFSAVVGPQADCPASARRMRLRLVSPVGGAFCLLRFLTGQFDTFDRFKVRGGCGALGLQSGLALGFRFLSYLLGFGALLRLQMLQVTGVPVLAFIIHLQMPEVWLKAPQQLNQLGVNLGAGELRLGVLLLAL